MCKGKLLLDLVTTWRKLVRMPKCLATYIEKKMSWDLFTQSIIVLGMFYYPYIKLKMKIKTY